MSIKLKLKRSLRFLEDAIAIDEEYKGENWENGIRILNEIRWEVKGELRNSIQTIWENSICANREMVVLTIKLLIKTI